MIDAFIVIMLIASVLALIFTLRCLILMFVCDYEMWKRKKKKMKNVTIKWKISSKIAN